MTDAGTADRRTYAWRVLTVSAVGAILSGINTSTMDVALPVVSRHFNSSATEASWTLLSFMLVNTALILVFGRVADMVGRRRLYLIGLATLTIASLACAYAPDAYWLIAFRAVQAVGAAALLCNVTALITDAFPISLLSTALGINVTIAAASQVLGPVLGGALVAGFGWRAVFWFNVPVGALGLIWARVTLRADPKRERRERFDLLGAVCSTLMLGGVVVALSEGGALGWTSPAVIVGGVLFVVMLPLFILVETRRDEPMLDLRLFADRQRSLAYVSLFLMALARFAVVMLIALYLQAAENVSPFDAGLQVIPVALGMAVTSPIAGRLARRHGPQVLSSSGMAASAVGLFVLAFAISPDANRVVVSIALLLVGAGSGMFMTPNTSSIMASVAPSRRGIANGVRQGTQNAGCVVSTALALAIVTGGLPALDKKAAYAGTLSRLSPHLLSTFTSGYRDALLVLAGACVLGMIASLLRNPRRPRPTSTEPTVPVVETVDAR